ncbi:MAG: CoF synthetase [Moritella sp.]|uniref:hypothetical protein n=1 Tax=Moritella sp. TaxID=78556 RepID=UPI001E03E536|nr:hypothetical protein [Moritella sp.]NQZ48909.1 CoF synthetase [Moritella sp.]
MKSKIKKVIESLPAWLGSIIAALPFKYRLGESYTNYKLSASNLPCINNVFLQVKQLVLLCESDIPFYKNFYKKHNFTSEQLNSFEDLQLIPIVTKDDLQQFEFEQRVVNSSKGMITNTGGTSGQPLKLLLDKQAHSREWAHMHTIWEKLGYKTSSIKLTLRGMNLGDKPLNYNFIHNEFQVNAYCDFYKVALALEKTLKKHKIEYLHGYPSGIYEFIKQLDADYPLILDKLKENLKGVFFGSEYPAPIYRDYIESKLSIPTMSWYGHTEMAVLAYEKEKPFVYHPFQSYGFTESVEIDGQQHLIGTTIHNEIGPLIRYDTGDIIEPLAYKNGLLESFKITEGRTGEFVTDKNGRNISLTALIFGRHHDIFGSADFIQVQQSEVGQLIIFVTTNNPTLNCAALFDSQGIEMDINFEIVNKPFKTKAGKVPLIVKGEI